MKKDKRNRAMKTLIPLLFFLIPYFSMGQRTTVIDLTVDKTISINPRSDSSTTADVGKIAFDADDDKLRFNDGTGWFSFLKEGGTLPYWPLTGTADMTGNVTITTDGNSLRLKAGDSGFATADSVTITGDLITDPGPIIGTKTDWSALTLHGIVGFIDENNGGETSFMKIGGPLSTPHTWRFHDYRSTKVGIQYENPDTTDWTDNTLSTRKYVVDHIDTKLSDFGVGRFLEIGETNTADEITTIDGDGNFIFDSDTVEFIGNAGVPTVIHKKSFIHLVQKDILNATGSPVVDESTFNLFLNFASGPSSGDIVTMSIIIHATATENGVTGMDFYTSQKAFTFRKNYDGVITRMDATTIFEHETMSSDLDLDFVTDGVSDTALELHLQNPANSEVNWTVTAEVIYSFFFYTS